MRKCNQAETTYFRLVTSEFNGRFGDLDSTAAKNLPQVRKMLREQKLRQRKPVKSRIVLVRDLHSEGRLSQISIEDRGSALGWELSLDAICINGSYAGRFQLVGATL